MNIKNFRYYNERHGQAAGNQILMDVFNVLATTLSENDAMIREYADNYIILKHCDSNEQLVAEWLRPVSMYCLIVQIQSFFIIFIHLLAFIYVDDKTCSFEKANDMAELCRKYTDTISYRVFSYEVYKQEFFEKYMRLVKLKNGQD